VHNRRPSPPASLEVASKALDVNPTCGERWVSKRPVLSGDDGNLIKDFGADQALRTSSFTRRSSAQENGAYAAERCPTSSRQIDSDALESALARRHRSLAVALLSRLSAGGVPRLRVPDVGDGHQPGCRSSGPIRCERARVHAQVGIPEGAVSCQGAGADLFLLGRGRGLCSGARRCEVGVMAGRRPSPQGLGLDVAEHRRVPELRPGRLGWWFGSWHRGPHDLRMGSWAAEAFLRPVERGMVRSGHDQTGSSRSSTSPPVVGVMPISSSRPAVSEPGHAARLPPVRQRISPSRRP